jgi:transposase
MTRYVGIDIGKKNCVACVMNEDGSISELSSYPNSAFDAMSFAKRVAEKYGAYEAVMESTGNMWYKTYEALESVGVKVKLANPLKTRAIAEAKVKTDKIDSKILAHLLRADLVAECYVPRKEVRQSRSFLAHKLNITREQTRIGNRIRNLLDKYDLKCEYQHIFGKLGIQWLQSLKLEGYDQKMLESLLRQLEFLNNEELIVNQAIASEATNSDYVKIIMSMPGFNYYGASLLAAYIADITRFISPSHLVSWAGLCPSVYQSGESLHLGKMKDGNRKVKWITIQAANAAIRCDPMLKSYYEKKLRTHHRNIALTHVANKMLKILWHMLSEKRLYNERSEKLYQSKLKRLQKAASE